MSTQVIMRMIAISKTLTIVEYLSTGPTSASSNREHARTARTHSDNIRGVLEGRNAPLTVSFWSCHSLFYGMSRSLGEKMTLAQLQWFRSLRFGSNRRDVQAVVDSEMRWRAKCAKKGVNYLGRDGRLYDPHRAPRVNVSIL